MAPKQLPYFDVRRRQRHNSTGYRIDIPKEQSINLMCFLLRGITYKNLYADDIVPVGGRHLFDELIANALALPDELQVDADGNACDMTAVFTTPPPEPPGAFDRVKALIDEYNGNPGKTDNIKLGDLFLTPRNPTPATELELVRNRIVDALDNISNGKPQFRHFCAPFVGIQLQRASIVSPADFKDFMDNFKSRNVEYFYTAAGSDIEKIAARRARDAGILSEAKGNYRIRGDGNGKWCFNGTCCNSNSTDTWCEMVYVNGNWTCALGSDHGDQCYTNPPTATALKKPAAKKPTPGKKSRSKS